MSLYERMHAKLGTAGLIVAVCALVLSLLGGAYAATSSKKGKSKSLTTAQVRKIAKQEAQKYANSNPGAPGQNGTNGTNGAKGSQGEPGESVTITPLAAGECANEEGGAKFTVGEEEAEACNGAEGSPWTVGGKLPSHASEHGVFSYDPQLQFQYRCFSKPGTGDWGDDQCLNSSPGTGNFEKEPIYAGTVTYVSIPISFPIPLPSAIDGLGCPPLEAEGHPCNIHLFEGTETPPTGCSFHEAGGQKELVAAPGVFCAYNRNPHTEGVSFNEVFVTSDPESLNTEFGGALEVGKSGTVLQNIFGEFPEDGGLEGVWAVTAP
jgi:hypothetical protein